MSSNKINWNRYSYTEQELREAVKDSHSFRQTLLKLDLSGEGAGYKTVKRLIKILNIDTNHWLGQGWSKGLKLIKPGISLEEILIENSTFTCMSQLKKKLIKNNVLTETCQECNIIEWRGQKLSLHIDHINGVNNDNRIENLRLLCPNCHSLTPTYCGKNIKSRKINSEQKKVFVGTKIEIVAEPVNCIDNCGRLTTRKSKRCRNCSAKLYQPKKIQWPSIDWLEKQLKIRSCLSLAKELGVSDNSIRKHIKNNKMVAQVGFEPTLDRF